MVDVGRHHRDDARVLLIDGTSNFRDFGGRVGGGGLSLPTGRLFRSAHLGKITAAGAATLRNLGIATIVDLRGVTERVAALPVFADNSTIEVLSSPIEPQIRPSREKLEATTRPTRASLRDVMIDSYRHYVRARHADFAAAASAVLAACDRPLVVHCTAGKDRTGFLVAMLHAAAGVDRAEIFDDYLMTNRHWARDLTIPAGMDEDTFAAILDADTAYLEAAFDEMTIAAGSVEAYLATRIGLDDRARERLVRNLSS